MPRPRCSSTRSPGRWWTYRALNAFALPVLIQEQSGTGKELLARHIHRESERGGLFVALSYAALCVRHGEAELSGQASSGRVDVAFHFRHATPFAGQVVDR